MNVDATDPAGVERRAVSVGSVRRVVHAIWALARAQLPKVEEAAREATVYLEQVEAVVDRLAAPAPAPAEREILKVALGPERPFCGSLHRRIAAALPPEGPIGVVGTRLLEALSPDQRARLTFALPGPASAEDLGDAARAVAAQLLEAREVEAVELLHPWGGGPGLYRATLWAGERELQVEVETFSPAEEVLGAALGQLVTGRLVVGLAEALRAEVRARISASDAARRACDEHLEELEQIQRVLRKEAMTAEILELTAGRLAGGEGG